MARTESTPPKPFRVVVIGAGIAGLSFSHALQLANIDHVVLEKHNQIESYKGAALVVWPVMARIFDQFGFMDKIYKATTPFTKLENRWPDGTFHSLDTAWHRFEKMFDTHVAVLDRQSLVTHIYDNLPDKSRVRLSARVERIEHTESSARVTLSDGSVEECDMVVGADGVHSVAKLAMWDYAGRVEPGTISDSEKTAHSTEYLALFGVSKQKDSFDLGRSEYQVTYGHGNESLIFTQPGLIYWGFMVKDEYSKPPKRRKFTAEDMEALAKRFANKPMKETVTFGDLWETKTRAVLVNLEEGILSKWHAGRIVLVGDSAHKMTADLGMGGNLAVEDIATLCNILHRELKSNPSRHPSQQELAAMFEEYQKMRYKRTEGFVKGSGVVTRLRAYHTFFGRILISYFGPYLDNSHFWDWAYIFANGPKLDFAPCHITNENAEGWKLKKNKGEKAKGSRGWLTYVLLTSTIGVGIAYAAKSGYTLPVFKW